MKTKLLNRVALVTGAAFGIGKAIAVLYAREGAKVVLADIDMEGAGAVVAEIEAGGGTATGHWIFW